MQAKPELTQWLEANGLQIAPLLFAANGRAEVIQVVALKPELSALGRMRLVEAELARSGPQPGEELLAGLAEGAVVREGGLL